MKRFIPIKYVMGLTIFWLMLFPIGSFACLYILVGLIVDYRLPVYAIFVFLSVGIYFEISALLTKELNSVVFTDESVSNYILDGTNNDGWTEALSDVKSVELMEKNEIKQYYKQFNKNKGILIDFGNHNIKYIYAGGFSKRQIEKIIRQIKQR